MAGSSKWNPEAIADDLARVLQMDEDLIINEVRTAESRSEAIRRLKTIQEDVSLALDAVLRRNRSR